MRRLRFAAAGLTAGRRGRRPLRGNRKRSAQFRIPHSAFRIPHYALRIPHSALPSLSLRAPEGGAAIPQKERTHMGDSHVASLLGMTAPNYALPNSAFRIALRRGAW